MTDMTMNDIELYLSKSNDRKSAKEGKNLYESGHVSEVEFNNISDCLKFCYVRGKVVPQTRIGENPYTVWVCLNTTNGDILTGECGCLAGYGESCKHVSSLLHYIEYEVRVGNNKTCASNPGLDVATCGVANATSFYSVTTKFSHLVANLAPQDR